MALIENSVNYDKLLHNIGYSSVVPPYLTDSSARQQLPVLTTHCGGYLFKNRLVVRFVFERTSALGSVDTYLRITFLVRISGEIVL